jgi:hypothetical protein
MVKATTGAHTRGIQVSPFVSGADPEHKFVDRSCIATCRVGGCIELDVTALIAKPAPDIAHDRAALFTRNHNISDLWLQDSKTAVLATAKTALVQCGLKLCFELRNDDLSRDAVGFRLPTH